MMFMEYVGITLVFIFTIICLFLVYKALKIIGRWGDENDNE